MGASLPPSQELFTQDGLAGEWKVTREIEDRRTGTTARLDGKARFQPDTEGLRYDEVGTLTLATGQSFASTQCYLWRFDGPVVRVLFRDGRLFHMLDPTAPSVEQVHLCGDDTYRGRFLVTKTHWDTQWQVDGPQKKQLSRIRYMRP